MSAHAVGCRVHHARGDRRLFGVVVHGRGLGDRLMRDRGQRPVPIGAEPYALNRRCPEAAQREHLLPRQGELDGAPDDLRRHDGQNHVRVGEALGPELPSDVGRYHSDPVG